MKIFLTALSRGDPRLSNAGKNAMIAFLEREIDAWTCHTVSWVLGVLVPLNIANMPHSQNLSISRGNFEMSKTRRSGHEKVELSQKQNKIGKIGLTDLLPQPQGPTDTIFSPNARHAKESIGFKRVAKKKFATDVTTRDYYFKFYSSGRFQDHPLT